MQKETAKKLLSLVNNKIFKPSIELYVEERLRILRNSLEISSDINEIYKIQGMIKEVKRLSTLQEEVVKESRFTEE